MTKHTLSVLALIFWMSGSAAAQSTRLAVRGGPAMEVLDQALTLAAAVDFTLGEAPIALSPSVEIVSNWEGLSRKYFGINVLLTKPLDASGVFGGVGLGSARWSSEGNSRDALVYDALVGYRKMASETIGFFGQAKFIINSKTNSDTDAFNSGDYSSPFLFDNDSFVTVGVVLMVR